MVIERKYLTLNPYSRPGEKMGKVKKVVIHYVGNPGSTGIANRNYFEGLKEGKGVYASSHYIIGLDGEIIQCVPLDEVAYHAKEANRYAIGIECCHQTSDGAFNEKTLYALGELCQRLCADYKLNPEADIIRHYDVTGKLCPKWFVEHEEDWRKFKRSIDKDRSLKDAVEILQAQGVVSTPEAWNEMSKINCKYLSDLLQKFFRVRYAVEICCYNNAIVGLWQQGVIQSMESWLALDKPPSQEHIRSLLIKLSLTFKEGS